MPRTTMFGVELPPTPPPTAPSTPPIMPHASNDLGSPQASLYPSRDHQDQQLPEPLFRGPPSPRASFSASSPFTSPPRPPRISATHPSTTSSSSSSSRDNTRPRPFLGLFDFEIDDDRFRPLCRYPPVPRHLNAYFGPHLNNERKRERAVFEYILSRMTQELTRSFMRHILLTLFHLPFFSRHDHDDENDDETHPPPRTDAENLLDHLVLYAILLRELASLSQYENAMCAVAGHAVRTMWLMGLPARTVADADAFVRGERGPVVWFRIHFGDSYRSYLNYRYHPTSFRRGGWYARWREGLGLDRFRY